MADRVLTESTPMMEYIDDAFEGPPLQPSDPLERWRMRWWMRFFDAYFAPSLSMIGWSVFVGPATRQRDPAELRAAIERIPLESRRIAWRKAMFNEFSEQELAESTPPGAVCDRGARNSSEPARPDIAATPILSATSAASTSGMRCR